MGKMPISLLPSQVTRPESYDKGLLVPMIVSNSESTRTDSPEGATIPHSGLGLPSQQNQPIAFVGEAGKSASSIRAVSVSKPWVLLAY